MILIFDLDQNLFWLWSWCLIWIKLKFVVDHYNRVGYTQWHNKPKKENFILTNLREWENDERWLIGLLVLKTDLNDFQQGKSLSLKRSRGSFEWSFLSFLQPSQKGGRGSLMSKRWQSVSEVIISFWWQRQELVEKNISATKDD